MAAVLTAICLLPVSVQAVPDRTTSYMLQSMKKPSERYYQIKTGEATTVSSLFRRSIYDQVEFGFIQAPMEWMSTDKFGSMATNSTGGMATDYDSYELVNYTGSPIMEYVSDPQTETAQTIRSRVQELVSVDVDDLKLTEVLPISVSGYEEQQQKAPLTPGTEEPVTLSFVNDYPADMEVVAVLGSEKAEASGSANLENIKETQDWKALRAESTGDSIVVYMTPEALAMANNKNSVLALLFEDGTSPAAQQTAAAAPADQYVYQEVERVVGSITVTEMVRVRVEGYAQQGVRPEVASEAAPQQNFSLHVEELSPRSMTVFKAVANYVYQEKGSAVSYFGQSVRNEIQRLLPSVNPDKMQIEEVMDCDVTGYDFRHGDLLAQISLPEQVSASDKLVAVVGSYNSNGQVHAWTALKAVPQGNGVRITITQNILTRMDAGDKNILFVLREAK